MPINAAEYRGKTQEFTISGVVTRQMDRDTKIAYVTGTGGGYVSLPKILTGCKGRTVIVANACSGSIVVVKPVLGGSAVALNTVDAGKVGFFTLKSSAASSDTWVRALERSLGAKMSHSSASIVVASTLPTYSPDCSQIYQLTDCSTGDVQYTRADLQNYVGQVISFDDLLCQAVSIYFGNDPTTLLETDLTNLTVWTDCLTCLGCEDPTWYCDGCCFIDGESYVTAVHQEVSYWTSDGCPPITGVRTDTYNGGGTFDAASSSAAAYYFIGTGTTTRVDTLTPSANVSKSGDFECYYGVCSTREIQRITASGTVSGGTFRIGIDTGSGVEYTTALPWDVDADEVRVAIEALSGVSLVIVTGNSFPSAYIEVTVIVPEGNLATFTIDDAAITGGGSVFSAAYQNGSASDIKRVTCDFVDLSSGVYTIELEDHPSTGLDWTAASVLGYDANVSIAVACSGAAASGDDLSCGGQIVNTAFTTVEVVHPS